MRGIHGENPDKEDGLSADRNEEGEEDKGLDTVYIRWASHEGVILRCVSLKERRISVELLTAFVRVIPPNANAQAIAHAFRMKTGFFQRCELVRMRTMLMGTSAPSQKALRIMSLSCPSTATLVNCVDWAGGVYVWTVSRLLDEFILRECSVVGGGSSAAEGMTPIHIYTQRYDSVYVSNWVRAPRSSC